MALQWINTFSSKADQNLLQLLNVHQITASQF